MNYCIAYSRNNKEKNAGAKAPDDIIEICKTLGFEIYWIPTNIEEKNIFTKIYWKLIIPFIYWSKFFIKLKNGDKILFQHPLYAPKVRSLFFPLFKKIKKIYAVGLIHDIKSLRMYGEISESELKELLYFDKLIVHNINMYNYLSKNGVPTDSMEVLEIFDYIVSSEIPNSKYSEELVIAGNLDINKARYIYSLAQKNQDISINLYGVGLVKKNIINNMNYFGSYNPEELVKFLQGKFGIVWDGTDIESCNGEFGEYLKYNNPHKTSLYLASGLPVIIWNEAALSSFIVNNNLGIAVDSLSNISGILNKISVEEYRLMKKNSESIAKNLRQGYYTKKALKKCNLI